MWKQVPEELTVKLGGDWFYNNILKGHGSLLANYKTMGDGTTLEGEDDNEQRGWEDRIIGTGYDRYDFISEGDSPSFFYLLDTGLRSMEDPTYGGWGGRFGVEPDGTYKNTVEDYNIYDNKLDKTYTLTRWFNDIQNDFGARADWCVANKYEDANHRPTVAVTTGLDITAAPGERVSIGAKATDPDGDKLTYKWWQYYEADTYSGVLDGEIQMAGASTDKMSFTVPEDAEDGDTIHMVIEVYDNGAHNMKHYQRVILTVEGREELGTLTLSLPENVNADHIELGTKPPSWGNSPYAQQLTVLNDGTSVPKGKTFKWTSADENVATVNVNGVVTPKEAGTVTITATANDGSGKTVSITLTVVIIDDSEAKAEVKKPEADEVEKEERKQPEENDEQNEDDGEHDEEESVI